MKLILQLTGASVEGGLASQVLEQGSLTIGRSPAADWVIPDPTRIISKLHCRIDAVNGGFVLTDTSTNGVFVGGAAVPLGSGNSIELHDGDRFRIGDRTVTVQVPTRATEASGLPPLTTNGTAAADQSGFPIDDDFLNTDWTPAPVQNTPFAEPLPPVPSESAPGGIPENWFAPASAGALHDPPALPRTGGFGEAARLLAETLGIPAPSESDSEAFLTQLGRQHRQLVDGLLQSLSESVALRREFGVGDAAGAEPAVDGLPVPAVLGLLLNGPAGERTLATAMAALRHHQGALFIAFRDVLRSLPADLAATLREVVKRGYAAAAQPAPAAGERADPVPPWPQARK